MEGGDLVDVEEVGNDQGFLHERLGQLGRGLSPRQQNTLKQAGIIQEEFY